jgi:DNA helicase-2/ATP-dependent DNA helicase PcrA
MKYEGITEWLLLSAEACEKILIEEALLLAGHAGVFTKSADLMLADMRKYNVDVPNMAATELGMIAIPKDCMSLLTMHQSKGREFEAVAVICVHEGRVPHFTANTPEEIDESRRLLYVAATRAKKVLMYFTDQSHHKNKPSRFLKHPYLGMC